MKTQFLYFPLSRRAGSLYAGEHLDLWGVSHLSAYSFLLPFPPGKTAAFALPVLERLIYKPRQAPVTRVLVLVPTRELGIQVHSVIKQLAQFCSITTCLAVGECLAEGRLPLEGWHGKNGCVPPWRVTGAGRPSWGWWRFHSREWGGRGGRNLAKWNFRILRTLFFFVLNKFRI